MAGSALNSDSPRPLARLFKIAVSSGIEAAVRLHIGRGDDLEGRDEKGMTPLQIAASRDRAAVCQLLLDAGADATATDPAGRDALAIARASSAHAATGVISRHIEPVMSPAPAVPSVTASAVTAESPIPATHLSPNQASLPLPTDDTASGPQHDALTIAVAGNDPADALSWDAEDDAQLTDAMVVPAGNPAATGTALPAQQSLSTPDGLADEGEDDFLSSCGWEPEESSEPPTVDPDLIRAQADRQEEISRHVPAGTEPEWEEAAGLLPERAVRLRTVDDSRHLVRRLLLRAIREGSVPSIAIENALSAHGDGADRNPGAEAALAFVIGDLGADIDEREENSSAVPADNFEVWVDDRADEDEEAAVGPALDHFEDIVSGRTDPIRMHYRAAARHPLLTPEQEQETARGMSAAAECALDALAQWPRALDEIERLLAAAHADASVLSSVVLSSPARGNAEDAASDDTDPEDGQSAGEPDPEAENEGAQAPAPEPGEVLERIVSLRAAPSAPGSQSGELRSELGRLNFRRSFLLRLEDLARADKDPGARAFCAAIAQLQVHRSRMAEANQRLVFDVARRYINSGIPVDDLIQEGNLGLLSAIDRFDWTRGFRFSTMATWWVRQAVSRGVADKSLPIRVPVHMYEKLYRLRVGTEQFERRNGRSPTESEQAELCGLTVAKLALLVGAAAPQMDLDEASCEYALYSDDGDDATVEVARRQEAEVVQDLLSGLKLKDAQILRQRYGIGTPDARTLEEVGAAFELTRERIRQIEAKLLRGLGSPHVRKALMRRLGRGLPGDAKLAPGTRPARTAKARDAAEDFAEVDASQLPAVIVDAQEPESPVLLVAPAPEQPAPTVRALADAAWELGVPVSVEQTDAGERHTFGVLHAPEAAAGLVHSLVATGFEFVPGVGYRK
ncbi:sigma-70 family RNA polymerase sigma factor [Variovorax ginsengisoli]|uniref:RNA polymerase sigma factor n=1 Tax=Variovorax ginsengisoli TaxID=363844 RepID=A0ABT8SCJ3_9BURK|nr:sigma-70 family RNA polymerase sigma factor [Variovorax ginsengisoli]MDN8617290.1 sigma-70 family RNA polymerase sigma factor [Variovorax ginsengisoli]MDO1536460.1 sigma-70 family RNA polymerase sigma factor [Variovorax ginsengisoli]